MKKAIIWIVMILLILSLIVPSLITIFQTNVLAPESPSIGTGETASGSSGVFILTGDVSSGGIVLSSGTITSTGGE